MGLVSFSLVLAGLLGPFTRGADGDLDLSLREPAGGGGAGLTSLFAAGLPLSGDVPQVLPAPLNNEVPDGVVAAVAGDPFAPESGEPGPFGVTDPTALTASGIPARVYQAYVQAAAAIASTYPRCRISWAVLAGIGRVETHHGRFGGSGVTADGRIVPPIFGIRLDGTRAGTARISDTDNGRYDGDAVFDRAVGPMQFIPGTWASFGMDADGDGRRDPQDIDDAALGAARYLCAGGGDLSTNAGLWAAVYRYNHSDSYVSLVLSLAATYASGKAVPFPDPPPGGHPPATGNPKIDGPGTPGGTPPGIGDNPKPSPSPSPSPSPTRPPKPTTPPPTTSPPPTSPPPTSPPPTSPPPTTPPPPPPTTNPPPPTTNPPPPTTAPPPPTPTPTCDPLATPVDPTTCPDPGTPTAP